MDNKKELIDHIRDELKKMPDRPYRAGAWEAFRAKQQPVPIRRPLSKLWIAASIAAVIGVGAIVYVKMDSGMNADQIVAENSRSTSPIQEVHPIERPDLTKTVAEKEQLERQELAVELLSEDHYAKSPIVALVMPESMKLSALSIHNYGVSAIRTPQISSSDLLTYQFNSPQLFSSEELEEELQGDRQPEMILAQTVDPNFAKVKQNPEQLVPKKMRLSKRFELGLFLSPARTSETFDMGGGLLVAYKLSKNLAIRTGASFNQYEVGILAADMGKKGKEPLVQESPVFTPDGTEMLSKDIPYRINAIIKPNLKSVSGKVQTLDIPVELKYNVSRDFYVVGGLSSAIVLSQERFNHMTEYNNSINLSTDKNVDKSMEGNKLNQKVTKLASKDNNVSTNGFGGFINLSIGKKTDISRSLKVSIEPFVKLPVGQFKRADMNYTNGGIKIITSF